MHNISKTNLIPNDSKYKSKKMYSFDIAVNSHKVNLITHISDLDHIRRYIHLNAGLKNKLTKSIYLSRLISYSLFVSKTVDPLLISLE